MKKYFLLLAMVGLGLAIVSCDKEEEKNVNLPTTIGTAIVKGKVLMDSDRESMNPSNALVYEKAPVGTQVIATVALADLVQGSSSLVEKKSYFTTTDENGDYQFIIDAGAKQVSVTVAVVDIEHPVIEYKLDGSTWVTEKHIRTKWSTSADQTVNVQEKQIRVLDIIYDNYTKLSE